MTWILWGIYGAIWVALVNTFIKQNPFGFSFWPMLLMVTIPTALGTQAGFIKFYWGASSFHVAWFLGSGFTAVFGILCSILIFKESISFHHALGIGGIIISSWLLIK